MFGEDPFDQEDTKNAGEITLRMPVCKLCEAPLKFDILMTNGPFINMLFSYLTTATEPASYQMFNYIFKELKTCDLFVCVGDEIIQQVKQPGMDMSHEAFLERTLKERGVLNPFTRPTKLKMPCMLLFYWKY
jgi:hypothetical protein